MVLVIGNTPKRVELADLKDCVYYKQQKVFTDAQYERSLDLQNAIKKGSLSILRRTEEVTGSFEVPAVSISPEVPRQPPATDTSKLDALMERIKSLEGMLASKPQSEKELSPEALRLVLDRVDRLEKDLPGIGNEQTLTLLYNAIRKLEERIDKGNANDTLLKKLEEIVSRAPTAAAPRQEDRSPEIRPEDVYVPNIIVEDANTHIKLNVRTIESGDSVSDSLKKLKELKSKFT